MVPEKEMEKAQQKAKTAQEELALLKRKTNEQKEKFEQSGQSKAKREADELREKLSAARQDEEIKLNQSQQAEEEALKKAVEDVKKRYYVNTGKLSAMKKTVAGEKDEMKDLKTKVKDEKKREKETEKAFKVEETQMVNQVKKDDAKKLKAEKIKEKGLEQKLQWDKRTVLKASKEEKAESKAMSAALSVNQKLEDHEKLERNALKQIKHEASTTKAQDEKIKKNMALGNAIEQEKEKVSAERIQNIRKRADEKIEEQHEEEEAAINSTKEKAAAQLEKMAQQIDDLKQKLKTQKSVENADISAAKSKMALQNEKDETALKNSLKQAEDQEEHAMRKQVQEDEKLKSVQAKLEDEREQEKNVLDKEKAEAQNFKEKLQLEDASLQKRLGARQQAAMLQEDVDSQEKQIKSLVKEDKALEGSVEKLSDEKQTLTKHLEEEEDKEGQAEYKVDLEKQKERADLLDYKKLKLKYHMLKEEAKNRAADANDDSLLVETEKKYQNEVQVSQTAAKEVDMLKAREKLMNTRELRLEERADKYKQEKEDEVENTKRVADSVRARWSTKLITAEAKHAKELMKLKHKMEQEELQNSQKMQKMKDQLDKETQAEEKAKTQAQTLKIAEKHALSLVGEEQVKNNVATAYNSKMNKVRKRYNAEFEKEYRREITKLKKKLQEFQNHHAYAKLKYKILMLKSKLRRATQRAAGSNGIRNQGQSSQGVSGVDAPPQGQYDMNTLLSSALNKVAKDAAGHTPAEQRKRVSQVVNSVVASGMAAEHQRAQQIVDMALGDHLPTVGEAAGSPVVKLSSSNQMKTMQPNALLLPNRE